MWTRIADQQDVAGSYDSKSRPTKDNTTGTNAHVYDYSYDAVDKRILSTETGDPTTWTYDLASRMTTSTDGTGITSYTFDANGNMTNVWPPAGNRVTMGYDKENRLTSHNDGGTRTTYTYDGEGLKRTEITGAGTTTLVWDGSNYLQERT